MTMRRSTPIAFALAAYITVYGLIGPIPHGPAVPRWLPNFVRCRALKWRIETFGVRIRSDGRWYGRGRSGIVGSRYQMAVGGALAPVTFDKALPIGQLATLPTVAASLSANGGGTIYISGPGTYHATATIAMAANGAVANVDVYFSTGAKVVISLNGVDMVVGSRYQPNQNSVRLLVVSPNGLLTALQTANGRALVRFEAGITYGLDLTQLSGAQTSKSSIRGPGPPAFTTAAGVITVDAEKTAIVNLTGIPTTDNAYWWDGLLVQDVAVTSNVIAGTYPARFSRGSSNRRVWFKRVLGYDMGPPFIKNTGPEFYFDDYYFGQTGGGSRHDEHERPGRAGPHYFRRTVWDYLANTSQSLYPGFRLLEWGVQHLGLRPLPDEPVRGVTGRESTRSRRR